MSKHDRTIIASLLGIIAVSYVVSLIVFRGAVTFEAESFATKSIGAAAPLDVYLDVVSFDPVREEFDVKVDLMGKADQHGKTYQSPLGRDIELRIGDGATDRYLEYVRGAAPASQLVQLETDGIISRYPFDDYASKLYVRAFERGPNGKRIPIPVDLNVWKGLPGWFFGVTHAPPLPDSAPNLITLGVTIHRPAPFVFFASTLYALMVVIAATALTLGGLVFLAIRKVEGTLISALAAMVFALPALRNALPGAPPLGVTGDIVILLWAEIIVALSMMLFVTAWARRGSGN